MTDDEPDNHYGDLRAVYVTLIEEHQSLKAKINRDDYDDTYTHEKHQREHDKGRRDATLEAVQEIEALLNEWNDADDRDGSTT